MDWSDFFTYIAQGVIVLILVGVVLAVIAAIRSER